MAGSLIWPAAAAGAAVGAAMIGLAYMAGKAIQSQALQSYSRVEIEEYVLAAFLAMLCLVLLSDAGRVEILKALTGGGFADRAALDLEIRKAYDFQAAKLSDVIRDLARNTLYVSRAVSYNFNLLSPNLHVPFTANYGKSPSAGGAPIISLLMTGADSTSLLLLLIKAERIIYFFFQFISLEYLLPAGLFMRFVPPARKAGGLLIAAAIGGLLIFPTATLWTDSMLQNPGNSLLPGGSMKLVADINQGMLLDAICNPVINTLMAIGEPLGGFLACLIPCLAGPQALGFFACLGAMSPFPQFQPPAGLPACWAGMENIIYYVTAGVRLLLGMGLNWSPLAMSTDDFVSNYYKPIVGPGGALEYTMKTALAIIAMFVLRMIAVVLIIKNLAGILASEGQIHGISKLI